MRSYVLFAFSIVLLLACTPIKRGPTEPELARFDYKSPPDSAEMPSLVRQYLKRAGYFDPNGAEIESCSEPQKGWAKHYPTSEELYAGNYQYYKMGWIFSCDINGKNRMGGFIGFRRLDYVYYDGTVVGGLIPSANYQPNSGGNGDGLFSENSNFVIWGN